MKKLTCFFVFLLLPLFSMSAQTVKIIEILDGGLYLTNDGRHVRMADLFIPSRKDTNSQFKKLAKEISEWENHYVKDNVFEMKSVDSLNDQSIRAFLYKHYTFGTSDLAGNYLSNGYAAYIPASEEKNKEDLSKLQDKAVKDRVGIWKVLTPANFSGLTNAEWQRLKYGVFTQPVKKEEVRIISNPCNSKLLAQLSAKDSLTQDEMKIFVELLKLCESSGQNYANVNKPYNTGKRVYTIKEYRNLPLLPVGIISFIGAYHFFKKASDKSDLIDFAHTVLPSANTSGLEDDKSAATWAGVGCILAGAVLTVISLHPVEVEVGAAELSFRYKF